MTKELKKLNYGLDPVDGWWEKDTDYSYLTDELYFKLGHKKNASGSWEYGDYPEIEFFEIEGKILALVKSVSRGYYGESDSTYCYLYMLRDETEQEILIREKRQLKEAEKAEAKILKEKNKAKLDRERAIKSAQTVLEKAGYKVIK